MNRVNLILAVFVLAFATFMAGAADQPSEKPVVVDPIDLRTPVPDPEKELTEKYDSKTVVFAGSLHSAGRDASSNQRWFKLAVQAIQEQSKPTAKPKMQTVVVKVYFAANERRLPTQQAYYTVQGMGEITVDGSLIIHNARTVSVAQKKPATVR
jgi:hypothetical protein